jgi:hypothetical protein
VTEPLEEPFRSAALTTLHLDVRPFGGKDKLFLPGSNDVYQGFTLSPSAMDTAEACMHKWALSRLDNHERESTPAAVRGTTTHAQLDAWLKAGTEPATKNMSAVLKHFPAPGQCESEQIFGFIFGREGREFVVSGRYDARLASHVQVQADGSTSTVPGTIYDLKTTSDFRYVKSESQLKVDIQAAIYCLHDMLRSKTLVARACWVYALVPKPENMEEATSTAFEIKRSKTVDVILTFDECVATLRAYVSLAEAMAEAIESKKKAKDVEKNSDSCADYGGCPWKKNGLCEVPVGGGFFALMKSEKDRGSAAASRREERGEQLVTINTERKMGLGARFATTTTPAAPAPPTAATSAVARPEVEAPAAGGLGGRFAPKAAAPAPGLGAQAPNTAAIARVADVGTNGGPAGSLMDRLRGIGAGSAAVAAVANGTQHDVSPAAPRAVGINPPDAAAEWSLDEQVRQAALIAAGKSAAAAAALPPASPTAQAQAETEAQKAAAVEADKAQKAAQKQADRDAKAVQKLAEKEAKNAAKRAAAGTGTTQSDMVALAQVEQLERIADALEDIMEFMKATS